MRDIRRRLPHYLGDFRDGLNSKCVASTLFLFFACLAAAVTFGGVMTIETGEAIIVDTRDDRFVSRAKG